MRSVLLRPRPSLSLLVPPAGRCEFARRRTNGSILHLASQRARSLVRSYCPSPARGHPPQPASPDPDPSPGRCRPACLACHTPNPLPGLSDDVGPPRAHDDTPSTGQRPKDQQHSGHSTPRPRPWPHIPCAASFAGLPECCRSYQVLSIWPHCPPAAARSDDTYFRLTSLSAASVKSVRGLTPCQHLHGP